MKGKQTITLIGWLWFGLGVLAFTSGFGGLLMTTLMDLAGAQKPKNQGPMNALWVYYRQAAAVQVVLAIFIAYTALNFVRRKPWARVGIQCFSVLIALWFLGFGVFWCYATSLLDAAPGSERTVAAARIFISVTGLVMMTALAAVFGFCAWFAGRPSVKEDFLQASQAKVGA